MGIIRKKTLIMFFYLASESLRLLNCSDLIGSRVICLNWYHGRYVNITAYSLLTFCVWELHRYYDLCSCWNYFSFYRFCKFEEVVYQSFTNHHATHCFRNLKILFWYWGVLLYETNAAPPRFYSFVCGHCNMTAIIRD